jgi:hypothetical protein
MTYQLELPDLADRSDPLPTDSFAKRAEKFCQTSPHRRDPYCRRNWGGTLHSLCSYQGKLKPSIAHFLVSWFSAPGDVVLDPMSGVGTIPFEARRQGRIGIGNDLSPLAYAVTSAKLEPVDFDAVSSALCDLRAFLEQGTSLEDLSRQVDVSWGLNKSIREYFHPETLRQLLLARCYFLDVGRRGDPAMNLLRASIMHILHGNRPYALSRRSHPVTPLAPTGPIEYRPLMDQLQRRIDRVLPGLLELASDFPDGVAVEGDFRDVGAYSADVVITSPPFARSLRFWSSNWMRLWFAGWEPDDFKTEPSRYLEMEQRSNYDPYREFVLASAASLKPGGRLIMHLGETPKENMVDLIAPYLEPEFKVVFAGRENVEDTETHGLTDKGATVAHWYLFAERA